MTPKYMQVEETACVCGSLTSIYRRQQYLTQSKSFIYLTLIPSLECAYDLYDTFLRNKICVKMREYSVRTGSCVVIGVTGG